MPVPVRLTNTRPTTSIQQRPKAREIASILGPRGRGGGAGQGGLHAASHERKKLREVEWEGMQPSPSNGERDGGREGRGYGERGGGGREREAKGERVDE